MYASIAQVVVFTCFYRFTYCKIVYVGEIVMKYNTSDKDLVAKESIYQQGRFFLHNLTTQNEYNVKFCDKHIHSWITFFFPLTFDTWKQMLISSKELISHSSYGGSKISCRWYICSLYLSTVSMASGSGGGIMKHAPGRVLVFPPVVWSFQFLKSALESNFIFSPRFTISWNGHYDKVNINIIIFLNFLSLPWPHLCVHPVAQGHSSGEFGGLKSAWLQRHDISALLPEGSQALFIPPDRWLISLKTLKH